LIEELLEGGTKMVIDGRSVGERMAINLMGDVFSALAVDFATVDREAALKALGRIELSIADVLTDFRQKTSEGIGEYDAAFDAMLETISALVENARDAVQSRGKPSK